jgi:predicted dehydrogenase
MTYSVALIGLGGIGMCYDCGLVDASHVLSHARAVYQHPDFTFVGAVDPVTYARNKFMATYKVPAYATIAELLSIYAIDVAIVASPTNTHIEVVRTILQHSKPKLILCEKPLAYDAEEADEIVRLCQELDVLLFVNYMRRADPGVIEVKERLDDLRIGLPFKSVVWYSKGLLHNGSHFCDLLTFWFGMPRKWQIIDPGKSLGEKDGEPDFSLTFDNGTAIFCAAKEENYSHYTLELVVPNGRLRYEQGGAITWQAAGSLPASNNHKYLQSPGEKILSDMNRYQHHVATQISLALQKKTNTLCNGATGAATIRLLQELLRGCVKNQE